MSLKKEFGNRIKQLRTSLSLSQEEFADKIGVHRNSLVRIERGDGFVSHDTLENIHRVLQLPYNEIFNFNETVKKDYLKAFSIKFSELNDADAEYFLTCINAYIKAKKQG
ncbi:MAG TPA: helix-turn-helix transcriptional regulator [Candidatus Stercorousia faecigallinarum]|nr:helix-turn-helix transcriptional regulator [Candidatus Stercorousia faecigallinarum]